MKPKKDLLAIDHKRWRNRYHKYLVEVVNVQDHGGKALEFFRTVLVRRVRGTEQRMWPAEVFLKTFDPVGRKLKKKTAWEILAGAEHG